MKKLFLVSFSMLLFTPLLFSQGKHKESTGTIKSLSKEDLAALPFTKGKWEYDITKPDLNFSHLNIKTNDVKQGSQSQFNLDLGANYYFANHLALGLSVIDNMSDFKSTGNSKQTDNSLMGYLNFTYGTALSTNVGFYARAGVGIGSMKDKYTPPTGPGSTDKSDLFGYKINAGLPISVEANGPVYFTPEVGYHSRRDKFDLGTETDEGFDFALKFETFLFCREMECDAHNGYNFSHSAYDQGRSYLGVETRGLLSFGDVKTKYTNNFPDQKENYTSVDLAANYMYYVVHDLSLGVDVGFSDNSSKNNGNKQTGSALNFEPMFELNMPSTSQALNNLFVRSGYGFGSQRSEYTTGATTTTTKYSTTTFCAGLGYNFFFHKGLSFTPIFEYDINTQKNKTSDVKTKYDGIDFSFGFRKFFKYDQNR